MVLVSRSISGHTRSLNSHSTIINRCGLSKGGGTATSFDQLSSYFLIHSKVLYVWTRKEIFIYLLDPLFNCKSVKNKHNMGSTNLMPFGKNNWEKDWNETISDNTWHKMVQVNISPSICLKHAVIQFKLVCWLSKIKADRDPTCDPATFHTCSEPLPLVLVHCWELWERAFAISSHRTSVSPWWAPI